MPRDESDSPQRISAREAGLLMLLARYEIALRGVAADYETSSRARELVELALGERSQ